LLGSPIIISRELAGLSHTVPWAWMRVLTRHGASVKFEAAITDVKLMWR
jgi:hypothetical protein